MATLSRSSAFARVTALAEQRPLHAAFRWLHLHGQQLFRWQVELVTIPAPPFGEAARSKWIFERFREAGLKNVLVDEIGNVFGELSHGPPEAAVTSSTPVILLSAHLDTVFPAETLLTPKVDHDRIEAPGACDNAAGVIGMLAIAHALVDSGMSFPNTLVFIANVGEEGEGDLRGVRRIYQSSQYSGRVAGHIVLDGAGAESAVTQALGSRRFQITIEGPGGHSFTDYGLPNPILVLASALANFFQVWLESKTSKNAGSPRTTVNVGTISGGTSVNSIPESAVATLDFRSTELEELVRLEVALHRAVEDSVAAFRGNSGSTPPRNSNVKTTGRAQIKPLNFSILKIGDRPAAELPQGSPLLEALKAVDRHLGLHTDLRLGSTDANIPLALGIPALSLGAGGDGGGAHTKSEWYCAANRELALRRTLFLVLTMLESIDTQPDK